MLKRLFIAFSLLLSSAASAQPGPPPSPWSVNGPQISYDGCALVPVTVTSGCKGPGTINASGLYINGVPVGVTSITAVLPLVSTPVNGVNTLSINNGVSVANPGTNTLETLLPIQTAIGTSKSFGTADMFRETRRSNSGSAMSDTFPASSATGLVNGTQITYNNVDATATATITAGAGTTINNNATDTVGPGRSIRYVYDPSGTTWRRTLNTGTALLGPNNLSDLSSASIARTNLIPVNTLTLSQLPQAGAQAILGNQTNGSANITSTGYFASSLDSVLAAVHGTIASAGDTVCFNDTSGTIRDCVGAGPVVSVFGRAGVVAATDGDYTTGQLTPNTSGTCPASGIGQCILLSNLSQTHAVTFTNGSANISWVGQTLSVGQVAFIVNTGGAVPTNFGPCANPTFHPNCYVVAISTNAFQISATPGGTAIVAGSAGTGTDTVTAAANLVSPASSNAQDVLYYSVPAGDWTCSGTVSFSSQGAWAPTQIEAALTTTSDTYPTAGMPGYVNFNGSLATSSEPIVTTGNIDYSFSAPTPVYLDAGATWTNSNGFANGTLRCVRKD